MKIFTKICLIISAVCLGLAIVCLGLGTALGSGVREVKQMADNGELDMGNWHIGNWGFYYGSDETDTVNQTGTLSKEDIDSLEIDLDYGVIYLKKSESEDIEVKVNAPESFRYKCENNDGTLLLKSKNSSRKWRNSEITITVAIPSGMEFDEVDINTDAGRVESNCELVADMIDLNVDAGELVAEDVEADDVSIDVGAGRVEIDNLEADNLKVDCGVGKAEISGTVSDKVKADCGVGSIAMHLDGKEEDYDYKISCGLGSVNVNGETYSSLSTDKKINNHSDREIDLDCGIGEIEILLSE